MTSLSRSLRLALSAAVLGLGLPAAAATYAIDPGHTNVGFKVKPSMVSNVRGSFAEVTGPVDYASAKPDTSKVPAVDPCAHIPTRQP